MAFTNAQMWDYLRSHNTNFANITSKATSDLFTERGFEALKTSNPEAINEFFNLSMRVAFQKVNVENVKNPLERIGLVERYDTPNGGLVQRMTIHSLKPTSPLYKGLTDGSSVDQQKVRKPKAKEYLYQQNFDYQSYVTLQDYQIKTIFISEFGMTDFVAGVMKSLANGYIKQSYANELECLDKAINSTDYPLKNSQKIVLSSWTSEPTAAELKELILNIKDIETAIETSPSTNAYNAGDFDTAYDPNDFVVLMRAGIQNRIDVNVELGAFNPDKLSLKMAVHEVQDFGGLVPYFTDENEQSYRMYPMYSSVTGEMIGYSMTEGKTGTVADFAEADIWFQDTNADIVAVIAQKGLLFENIQNPYSVVPAPYNAAGLYTTFWASSPNNAIVTDHTYGLIVILKPSTSRSIEEQPTKSTKKSSSK